MSNCFRCPKELVFKVELDAGACSFCLIELAQERRLGVEIDRSLQAELSATESRLNQAQDALVRQGNLLDIEARGRTAAERGAELSDNPYEDEDERLMWASGWSQQNNVERLARAAAVVRWSCESLESVEELMRGHEDLELNAKLEFIRSKLQEYVGEET